MAGCTNSVAMPVIIHDVPVAQFRTSSACVNVPYHLLDSSYVSQGSVTQWQWSFPDFTTSTQQNPYYTFSDTLQYNVTLVATSNFGCKDTVMRAVKVHPVPTASFISDVSYGDVPLDVNFTNFSSGASTYAWDFGDTSGTSGATNPSHTYTALGTYPVTLIANTLYGCTDTSVKYIFVINPVLDLAVTSVNKSSSNNVLSISAGVANLGNIAVTDFKISAWLENSLPVFENWNGNMSPQSALTPPYSFVAHFETSQVNPPHFLCVEITEVNGQQDQNPANNIKCINLDEDFVVIDPFPSPAEQVVNLQVVVTRKDFLSISVYDASGKLIRNIFNGVATAGLNKFILDTSSLANGTYFCKYTFSEKTIVKPLTHISKKK
jgi:PKD repeat protein